MRICGVVGTHLVGLLWCETWQFDPKTFKPRSSPHERHAGYSTFSTTTGMPRDHFVVRQAYQERPRLTRLAGSWLCLHETFDNMAERLADEGSGRISLLVW